MRGKEVNASVKTRRFFARCKMAGFAMALAIVAIYAVLAVRGSTDRFSGFVATMGLILVMLLLLSQLETVTLLRQIKARNNLILGMIASTEELLNHASLPEDEAMEVRMMLATTEATIRSEP